MNNRSKLVAVVGGVCCALLLKFVPQFEGNVLTGYLDPIGIPTKCAGDTQDVIVGKRYTKAECKASLETALVRHAEPVLACTPILKDRPYQLAAAISFAYNIGTSKYCASTTARRFSAHNFAGACKAMNEADSGPLQCGRPQWVSAGGKILPGLINRRAIERNLCEYQL